MRSKALNKYLMIKVKNIFAENCEKLFRSTEPLLRHGKTHEGHSSIEKSKIKQTNFTLQLKPHTASADRHAKRSTIGLKISFQIKHLNSSTRKET